MASKKKPVDSGITSKRKIPKDSKSSYERLLPKDTSVVKKVYWSFGFRYFTQIDLFGFSNSDTSWFVSVLQRLKDASQMEYLGMTQVLEDGYRYHEINWDAKNIPLQRVDFNWLSESYLDNEDEFPFCQFHISKGKGRIVGFWDENNIFQVLLLDPLHNLQPSKFTNYELRECYPAQSEYDSLNFDIQNILKSPCALQGCDMFERLSKLPSNLNNTNIVLAHLDDEFFKTYSDILKKKSIIEILEAGILSLA